MRSTLEVALSDGGGVVAVREHPHLRQVIRGAWSRGELRKVLHGIYAADPVAHTFAVRTRALLAADPDAILLGTSAATFHGWLDEDDDQPVLASSWRIQRHHAGFRLVRRRVPVEQIVERPLGDGGTSADGSRVSAVRATSPALTAIDLARKDGSDAIDTALRLGVDLDHLWEALAATPDRPGNERVRSILRDSTTRPWSAAEREGHRALLAQGVTGWQANLPVARDEDRIAALDIGFKQLLLGFEIDGYQTHRSHRSFLGDRLRDIELTRRGWHIVRMSASWVFDDPGLFASTVAMLVGQRALILGLDPSRWLGG